MNLARYRFVLYRPLQLLPVLFGISLITFVLVRSIPGDPARAVAYQGAPGANSKSVRVIGPMEAIGAALLAGQFGRGCTGYDVDFLLFLGDGLKFFVGIG